MVSRFQILKLAVELWLMILSPQCVPGVTAFPMQYTVNKSSSSSSFSSSSSAMELNLMQTPITMDEQVALDSTLWNALFPDESGHEYNLSARERATRAIGSECAPTLEQLKMLRLNPEDPMTAAALSLSRMAEMYYQSSGSPQDRLLYKLKACTKVARDLNRVLQPQNDSEVGVCRWSYTCNYEPNRFPQYVVEAVCQNNYCRDCGHFSSPCLPLRASMEVLRWTCASETTGEEEEEGSGAVQSVWRERIEPTLACHCRTSAPVYRKL